MAKDRNRHHLIERMIDLYLERAWTDAQLAEELETDRTNIYKIRTQELEQKMRIPVEPVPDRRGYYRINKEFFVANIRFTPAEMLALYLGGRRLQQQNRTSQKDVASALKKVADALHKPMSHNLVEAAEHILTQEQDERQAAIMQTLVSCWIHGRSVHIEHQKLHGLVRKYLVSPYQLEPAIWGDGIYLIGYSDYHQGIASFKLSRILRATETTQPYKTPEEFDSHALLQHAWGIWHADETAKPVKLKFNKYVTPRVKETIWHPSQTIQDTGDGGCIWQAEIAEWREMLPWVRGWGSDVEVLAPEGLREAIKGHARRFANMYDIAVNTAVSRTDRLLQLWGKTSQDTHMFHPALYHMFDVAHVAQQLLSPRATSRWRQVLGHTLGTNPDALYEWLPYLIALHDIGKLSVPFQILNPKQRERLEQEGFRFGRNGQKQHHTIVGRLLLNEYTAEWPTNLRHAFLDMVSGHHGVYQPDGMQDQANFDYIQEPAEWAELRQHAMHLLKSYLCPQWPEALPDPPNVSAAIAALNGFCILCDWLGSDGDYFTPKPNTPLPEYVIHSRQQAFKRVAEAGLFQTAVSHAPITFTQLFHDFTAPPRPLQTAIEQIPDVLLAQPTLTIIEAPTGEGKTEAALLLARRIAARRGTDEMYIALPTTATSNAMHKRIITHIEQRLGLKTNIQLIHGQSFLQEDDVTVNSLVNGENPEEDEAAENWFAPKKKALLAPFGVGTIDQAELSALNVRHNALRLIGLAGKTIILDEVHAYDTYMTTIIKRMLNWLSALGSSVILLSATLPKAKRRELMTAFAPQVEATAVNLDTYPNLLTIGSNTVYAPTEPIAVFQSDKQIHLGTLALTDEQAQEKADWLLAQVQDGGCACWITNTVNRAQAIFQALQNAPDVDLTLLHGRFPLAQRQIIETGILQKYGKPGEDVQRPRRGIVIGTQVLEQSLDLDFDLMVTDLAPIDLILQRAGRLHRHQRDLADRYTHTTPCLTINMIRDKADQAIYGDYILQMTERALPLQTDQQITLPSDYRHLIEATYANIDKKSIRDEDEELQLFESWQKSYLKSKNLRKEANMRLSGSPDPDDPFYDDGSVKDLKEDEDSAAWLAGQTRWSERETITVIPLVQNGQSARVAGDREKIDVSLMAKAPRDHQLHLLRHNLRVSHPKLVKAIKTARAEEDYPLFKSALLKNVCPLWLMPVEAETAVYANNDLDQPVYLHPKLGLVFGEYK